MAERFDHTDPLLAAVAWSRLAESDDGDARLLLSACGPVAALDWLIAGARGAPAGRTGRSAADWTRAAQRWLPRLPYLDPRRDVASITRLGGTVLLPDDDGWPAALNDLPDPPSCLWVRGAGRPDVVARRTVSLVGARACTEYGQAQCRDLAFELAERGFTIVSGGAFGIDAAAHAAALAAAGSTMAVMAGGLDRYYPSANTSLIERVAEAGCVLSEVPPGSAPMRSRFLRRNRLIAAVGEATVVVEAGWRSGALNTALTATTLLRPLGAVPGPVTSAASAGCHRLIRDGAATLITGVDDVMELLEPIGTVDAAQPQPDPGLLDGLDAEQSRVLDALPARADAGFDALVRSAGLAPASVRSALGFLEMAGRVERRGSTWRRVRQG